MAGIGVLKPSEAGRRAKAAVAQWRAEKKRAEMIETRRFEEEPTQCYDFTAIVASKREVLGAGERSALDLELVKAAKEGDMGGLRKRLEEGADLNGRDYAGRTAIMWAARMEHKEIVEYLFLCGADVNVADEIGKNALILAVQEGWEAIAKFLLDAGADQNSRRNDSVTVLMVAVKKGHVGIVRLLLDNEADANDADISGTTPLMAAAKHGHVEIGRLLLERGAKKDVRNISNETAMDVAKAAGKKSFIELLEEEEGRALEEKRAKELGAQLLKACRAFIWITGRVKRLVEGGAEIEARDGEGMTPLMWAAKRNHIGVVELLLEKGADVNAADDCKMTALGWAYARGNMEIAALLKEHGATRACL